MVVSAFIRKVPSLHHQLVVACTIVFAVIKPSTAVSFVNFAGHVHLLNLEFWDPPVVVPSVAGNATYAYATSIE